MESDLRSGGKWMMRGIDMGEKPLTIAGEYREIERPRLLVPETIVPWDLEEKDGLTTVRLTHSGFTSESARTTIAAGPKSWTA